MKHYEVGHVYHQGVWVKHKFSWLMGLIGNDLRHAPVVDTGHWQGQEDVPQTATRELQNVVLSMPVPAAMETLQFEVQPNLPWAEDHFRERVSGEPYNPPPSAAYWPYAQAKHKKFVSEGGVFSHTYPERFWPHYAGVPEVWPDTETWGLRYRLGDLDDMCNLLIKHPNTRQAYLPVWFPEDTGAVEGQRVPCSLGYHFLIREGKLNCQYFIRSCDFLRHFQDDVYMAARLMQWVSIMIRPMVSVVAGDLTMFMSSLHIFEGDDSTMERRYGSR